MKKLPKLLIGLLVAAGAVYGGLKGYLYFKYQGKLGDAIAMARPFAEISYGGFSVSLDGTLRLENLSIDPKGMDRPLRVEALELRTPGAMFLLNGGDDVRQGKLPEQLSLAVRGMRLPLDGSMVRMMESAAAARMGGGAPACGGGFWLSAGDYRELGYDSLAMDMRFGYSFPGSEPGVALHMDYTLEGMESMTVDMNLLGPGQSLGGFMGLSSIMLKQLVARYVVEAAHGQKVKSYCARANDQSVEEYLDSVAGAQKTSVGRQLGIRPGPGLRAALMRFAKQPGEIRVEASPSAAVDLSTLHRYRPEDLPALLNLTVTVNGTQVRDPGFRLVEPQVELTHAGRRQAHAASAASGGVQGNAQQQPEADEPQGEYRYRTVGARALLEHLGKRVRLRTRDGHSRQGVLSAVDNGDVSLRRRMYGGSMSVHVAVEDIDHAEVWLYGRD